MVGEPVTGDDLYRRRFQELSDEAKELVPFIEPDFTVDPPWWADDGLAEDFLAWRVQVRNLLSRACGVDSEHYKVFLEVEGGSYRKYSEMLDSLLAVFSAARADFEGGYVQSARTFSQHAPVANGAVGSQPLATETLNDVTEAGYPPGEELSDSDNRADWRFEDSQRYCTGPAADDVYGWQKKELSKALSKAAKGQYETRPTIERKWTLVDGHKRWVYRRNDVEKYERILKESQDG